MSELKQITTEDALVTVITQLGVTIQSYRDGTEELRAENEAHLVNAEFAEREADIRDKKITELERVVKQDAESMRRLRDEIDLKATRIAQLESNATDVVKQDAESMRRLRDEIDLKATRIAQLESNATDILDALDDLIRRLAYHRRTARTTEGRRIIADLESVAHKGNES